jgi:hypothetical protein
VLVAALIGYVGGRIIPAKFAVGSGHNSPQKPFGGA